jgi:octaprenyl-diphosphate synthase
VPPRVRPPDNSAPCELTQPLDNAQLKARVLALAAPADQALTANLKSHVAYIEQVSGYTIFAGGKRLRPVLFLLASAACGQPGDYRLSAIFEYLHAATLLHDDVVDQAGLRRGKPAARVKYGNDSVILVGDFLFSKSYSLAAQVDDIRFVRALTDCTTHMAEGQVLELLATDRLDLTLEGYLEVIIAKTAVLIAAACQMGALAAGAEVPVVETLYDYGMDLGIAFQLVDDALDYVGTEHEFGKPVGHDLEEGKITLPFIHARENAPPPVREKLLDLTKRGDAEPELLGEAKQIVRDQGGVEATFALAHAYALRAQETVRPLAQAMGNGPEWETLLGLPAYVVTRRS